MCKVFFFCQNVYYIGIITLMLQKTHYNLICDLEKCKGKPWIFVGFWTVVWNRLYDCSELDTFAQTWKHTLPGQKKVTTWLN